MIISCIRFTRIFWYFWILNQKTRKIQGQILTFAVTVLKIYLFSTWDVPFKRIVSFIISNLTSINSQARQIKYHFKLTWISCWISCRWPEVELPCTKESSSCNIERRAWTLTRLADKAEAGYSHCLSTWRINKFEHELTKITIYAQLIYSQLTSLTWAASKNCHVGICGCSFSNSIKLISWNSLVLINDVTSSSIKY